VVPEHPLLGTGPDTFDIAFTPFQSETQQRYGQVFDKAHNDYIQILVCCGVPALIAYLVLLIGVFVPAVPKAFDSPILFAALGAGLSYGVQSFFGVDVPIATPLFWLILGLAAQAPREQLKRDFD
jgi:O-antigen ligase